MSNLILYATDDGKRQIQLRADLGTAWLTQLEMADLFDATKQNISLHLKNIFEEGKLDANSVVKHGLATATYGEGGRLTRHNPNAERPILYTPCRELQRPVGRGNCQGILDSSSRKRLLAKRRAVGRCATHCVANWRVAADMAAAEYSSVVRADLGKAL